MDSITTDPSMIYTYDSSADERQGTTMLINGSGVQKLFVRPLLKQTPLVTAIYTVAYVTVFTLALINNSCVLIVILRNAQMRTVTNFFLANLAVADLIVSFIVLPITLLSNIFSGKHLY